MEPAEERQARIIAMKGEGRNCVDLARQLHAVVRPVAEAKRALIHDHIDHCLIGAVETLAEVKALTKMF